MRDWKSVYVIWWSSSPKGVGGSIPWACQDWAAAKEAYRFFSNGRVSEEQILAGHFLATQERIREQELVHLEWADIDWDGKVLRVRNKPQYDFKVKDSEQRDIPIPSDVLSALKKRRKTHGECSLILATSGYLPNHKLLRTLKRLAHRAGLNCGKCSGCIERNECQEWELHRFRRTYATNLLRNDVDIRTVQALMGHADLDSTLRYLTPAASSEIQDKINSIKW
jgi:integrase